MDKERAEVLDAVAGQLARIGKSGFASLIPEVGSNLAYAVSRPKDFHDIAAVPGRIRNAMGRPVYLTPEFGASTHLASTIMGAMSHEPGKRAVINIRYSPEIVRALVGKGLSVVFVDRMKEPADVVAKEGASVPWVLGQAIGKLGRVPDAVYHSGCVGKEPIVQIIAAHPERAVDIALGLIGEV